MDLAPLSVQASMSGIGNEAGVAPLFPPMTDKSMYAEHTVDMFRRHLLAPHSSSLAIYRDILMEVYDHLEAPTTSVPNLEELRVHVRDHFPTIIIEETDSDPSAQAWGFVLHGTKDKIHIWKDVWFGPYEAFCATASPVSSPIARYILTCVVAHELSHHFIQRFLVGDLVTLDESTGPSCRLEELLFGGSMEVWFTRGYSWKWDRIQEVVFLPAGIRPVGVKKQYSMRYNSATAPSTRFLKALGAGKSLRIDYKNWGLSEFRPCTVHSQLGLNQHVNHTTKTSTAAHALENPVLSDRDPNYLDEIRNLDLDDSVSADALAEPAPESEKGLDTYEEVVELYSRVGTGPRPSHTYPFMKP